VQIFRMSEDPSLRAKRLRVMFDILMESSDDDEDDKDSKARRVDDWGRHLRRGGWRPKAQQAPGEVGMAKWRHKWCLSKGYKLLQATKPGAPDPDGYWAQLFRARTGVPRSLFDEVVREADSYPEVASHARGDGQGRKGPSCIPLEIKVFGALYHMRNGGAITVAADVVDIDHQTLRRFIFTWSRAVVKHDYPKWVKWPQGQQLADNLALHARMGFPGMVSGSDGVAVHVTGVPWTRRNKFKGKDGAVLARNFNVSGNARRQIHHVHGSHDGHDNDKTMAQYDTFMQALKDGFYSEETFTLYTAVQGDGAPERQRGLWDLTDNGYHAWRVLQYPSKTPVDADDLAWSARAESVRKPASECIFGCYKKRWRLFAGVYDFGNVSLDQFARSQETFDSLFRVGCMLHNRLLHEDGIADLGTRESDWKRVDFARDLRRRIERMKAAAAATSLPASRSGIRNEDGDDEIQYEASHTVLHAKLRKHFACARDRGEVHWLRTAKHARGLRRDERPLEAGHRRCGEDRDVDDDDVVHSDFEDEGGDDDEDDGE
jgi:hypothetical protein